MGVSKTFIKNTAEVETILGKKMLEGTSTEVISAVLAWASIKSHTRKNMIAAIKDYTMAMFIMAFCLGFFYLCLQIVKAILTLIGVLG